MPGVSHRGPTTGAMGVGKVHFRFKPKKPKRNMCVKIIGTIVYTLFFSFAFFSFGWKYIWFRNTIEVPLVRTALSGVDNLRLLCMRWLGSMPDEFVDRDRNGVPLIRAKDTMAALRQQGYVHAKDRWLQMDFYRRTAFGELAAIFGEQSLLHDRLALSLQFGRSAAEDLSKLSTEEVDMLKSYSDGVNAYLAEARNTAPNAADYFLMFGMRNDYADRIRDWNPEDSLAIMRLQSYEWSYGWEQQLVSALFESTRAIPGFQYISEVMRNTAVGATGNTAPNNEEIDTCHGDASGHTHGVGSTTFFPSFSGSAVGVPGSLSESGAALLASDFYAPAKSSLGLWHLISIASPDFTVVGAGIPGIPFIFLGRSSDIGWTLSVAAGDDGTAALSDRLHWLTRAEEESLSTRMETIAIATDVLGEYTYDSYVTEESEEYGVIVSDSVLPYPFNETLIHQAAVTGRSRKLALRSTAVDRPTSLRFLHALNTARNMEEADKAVRKLETVQLNFLLADELGNMKHASSAAAVAVAAVKQAETTEDIVEKATVSQQDELGTDDLLVVEEEYEETPVLVAASAPASESLNANIIVFAEGALTVENASVNDVTTTGSATASGGGGEKPVRIAACSATAPISRTRSLVATHARQMTVDHLKDILLDTYSPSAVKLANLMHTVLRRRELYMESDAPTDTNTASAPASQAASDSPEQTLGEWIKGFFVRPTRPAGQILPSWTREREIYVFNTTRHLVHDFEGHLDALESNSPTASASQRSSQALVEAFRFTLYNGMLRRLSKTRGCTHLLQLEPLLLGGSLSPLSRMSVDLRRDPVLFFDALFACSTSHGSLVSSSSSSLVAAAAAVTMPVANEEAHSRELLHELSLRAILEAFDFCVKEMGEDVDRWSWGMLHFSRYAHFSYLTKNSKVLAQALAASGPQPTGGTFDTIFRTEPLRSHGDSLGSSVQRSAFLSDEQSFSSSIRMVLNMGNRVTGAEFSAPTASSGLFSNRWVSDGSLARWGAAAPRFRMLAARRAAMAQRFFGNIVVAGLARGVQAVALTLHDVFKLLGINSLAIFEGDVLTSETTDGIFSSLSIEP